MRSGRGADLARFTACEVRIGPRAKEAERGLQPKQRRKLEWWIARLRQDAFAGNQIPKNRIPPELARRGGLTSALSNAWRFELPLAYRGVYSVQSAPGIGTVVLILEILPHKDYNRLFGYR